MHQALRRPKLSPSPRIRNVEVHDRISLHGTSCMRPNVEYVGRGPAIQDLIQNSLQILSVNFPPTCSVRCRASLRDMLLMKPMYPGTSGWACSNPSSVGMTPRSRQRSRKAGMSVTSQNIPGGGGKERGKEDTAALQA